MRGSRGREFGEVAVTVHDDCGSPVSCADVTAAFSGDFAEQRTVVDYVDYGILIYDASSNVEICDAG
jgi:hypothetical protein